ncbi:hypothetical protein D3C85_749510 [compost metagenome]
MADQRLPARGLRVLAQRRTAERRPDREQRHPAANRQLPGGRRVARRPHLLLLRARHQPVRAIHLVRRAGDHLGGLRRHIGCHHRGRHRRRAVWVDQRADRGHHQPARRTGRLPTDRPGRCRGADSRPVHPTVPGRRPGQRAGRPSGPSQRDCRRLGLRPRLDLPRGRERQVGAEAVHRPAGCASLHAPAECHLLEGRRHPGGRPGRASCSRADQLC